jgi:hypothetical protein
MLKEEPSNMFRQKIISVLEKKLKILINGYVKRHRMNDAKECSDMLGALDEFRLRV